MAAALPAEDGVELASMWVAPHARGTGAAGALVDAVVAWADAATVTLYVVEANVRARRLYERHGFVTTGGTWTRERDGALGLVMRRPGG
jgi:ribosomal protein S18 acetylase RimI-like enzyme